MEKDGTGPGLGRVRPARPERPAWPVRPAGSAGPRPAGSRLRCRRRQRWSCSRCSSRARRGSGRRSRSRLVSGRGGAVATPAPPSSERRQDRSGPLPDLLLDCPAICPAPQDDDDPRQGQPFHGRPHPQRNAGAVAVTGGTAAQYTRRRAHPAAGAARGPAPTGEGPLRARCPPLADGRPLAHRGGLVAPSAEERLSAVREAGRQLRRCAEALERSRAR